MLRGALIGLGNVAVGGHLPGWARRRDVEIVAVADVQDARRAVAQAALPDARWFSSPEALLDEVALDFVDICTPPSSHGALIGAALRRGWHVLCEKPLVGSLEELAALSRLATESKRVLHTVHNWHHAPIVRRARELVREGAIGRVHRMTWHTLRSQPASTSSGAAANWRVDPAVAGGGVLTDHGWHVFYVLRSWANEVPTAVAARLETRRHTGYAVEDTATVQVAFPGATAEVLLTWAADVRDNRAEIAGTSGRIVLEDDVLNLRRGESDARWTIPPPLSQGSAHPDWFDAVADQFVAEMQGGGAPASNLTEATICLAVETAARESSRQGGRLVPLAAVLPGGLTVAS
jgi:predicted dehydrogenase